MNPTILNREFKHPADGWYQIEAKGEHPNRSANIIQVIDDEAATSIVNRFNSDAAAGKLRHGSELLVDHEHFSDQPDQETRAYGWLTKLDNRADGIYGQIRWTATGKPAVDGGDYRFFSTEYAPADLKVLNGATPKKVRPLRLDGLTLTNMNNNRGQKPITNRGENNFAGAPAPAANQPNTSNTKMKNIAVKFGLAAEASEEAILAEVTKVLNRNSALEAEATPLKAKATALEAENQTLLGEQCEALMDAHGIKADDKVRNRLKPVLTGLKNREDRSAALVDFGYKLAEAKPAASGSGQRKLTNRDTTPPGGKAAADTNDEAVTSETAVKIKNRASELKGAAPSRSFDSCWQQAKSEIKS